MSAEPLPIIGVDWPAPPTVRACATTRWGGVSQAPFDHFNLAEHVGDDPQTVAANRQHLINTLRMPEPFWLEQTHSSRVARVRKNVFKPPVADASVTCSAGRTCAVMTADCLPVLFCDRQGTRVAAAHAGWRGLAGGILEQTVSTLGGVPDQLLAWLGPAIGPSAYEVGGEVRDAFCRGNSAAESAFIETRPGHWHADLYTLARQRLAAVGVDAVFGGDFCTYSEVERFYSYRRDGRTGRMATMIWLAR
jgi:YfiH family protein